MSRIFGPITQNGYVVEDLDQAIDHWTRVLGIGPFFMLPPLVFDRYTYHGRDSAPELRVALANSGDLQIELIEQVNDAPSFYKDFLNDHGPGLQHLSVWTKTYDADTARFQDHGLKILCEGIIRDGIRFAYYDTELHNGCVMEVLDLHPSSEALFTVIRDAARDWDGSDPVRHLVPPKG